MRPYATSVWGLKLVTKASFLSHETFAFVNLIISCSIQPKLYMKSTLTVCVCLRAWAHLVNHGGVQEPTPPVNLYKYQRLKSRVPQDPIRTPQVSGVSLVTLRTQLAVINLAIFPSCDNAVTWSRMLWRDAPPYEPFHTSSRKSCTHADSPTSQRKSSCTITFVNMFCCKLLFSPQNTPNK
jgi:hypothetical protein